MAQLESRILDIIKLIHKRPSVDVRLVAKELGTAIAQERYDALDELHRGMVFGVCHMTPTRGDWDALPDDTRDALIQNLPSWMDYVADVPDYSGQGTLPVEDSVVTA